MKQFLKKIKNLPNFNFLQTKLTSPRQLKDWTERFFYEDNLVTGEVLNFSLKDNFENFKQKNGLFCELIFGPTLNYICSCGNYILKKKTKILFCNECKTELAHSSTRSKNLGYLTLEHPIINSFYLKSNPTFLTLLLNLKLKNLVDQDIIDFAYNNVFINYVNALFLEMENQPELNITKIEKPNKEKFTDLLFARFVSIDLDKYFFNIEVLKEILEHISLNKEIKRIRTLNANSFTSKTFLQLRLLESFLSTQTRPEWFILTIFPVISPAYRPFKPIEKRAEISWNINLFYLLICDVNVSLSKAWFDPRVSVLDITKLVKLLQILSDLLFWFNEKEANEAEYDTNFNARQGLTQVLEGKKGHLRQNLLGKRVDFSGRSVIVADPTLKLNQCGIPFLIAKEIFRSLLEKKIHFKFHKVYQINKHIDEILIDKRKLIIWSFINKIIKKESIILNRAPTLHKGSLQSFNPILTLDLAIHLHPLVCAAFNADFDGDQMCINSSLLKSSKIESLTTLKTFNNIVTNTHYNRIIKPNQEIILGCFYSTLLINNIFTANKPIFSQSSEAFKSFFNKSISLHQPILVNFLAQQLYKKEKEFFNNLFFKKIEIIKFYRTENKLFLFTSFGLILINKIKKNIYFAEKIFIEVTIGQLMYNALFSN